MRFLLLFCVLWIGTALSTTAHAQQDTQPVNRTTWGVLTDLAERDFVCGSPRCAPSQAIYFRWEKRGEVLLMSLVAKGSYNFTWAVFRKPDGSLAIKFPKFPDQAPVPAAFESDGSFGMSNEKTFWLLNIVDGSLNLTTGYTKSRADARPYRYVLPQFATDTEKVFLEDRRLKLGLASPSPEVQTASLKPESVPIAITMPRPQVAAAAASAPSMSVSSPLAMSNAPRIALVVGNGLYGAALGDLANPVRDANGVAAALRASGFTVEVVLNADQRAMKRAIIRLGERLNAAGRSATGLFYFAGHGMQSRGANFLVPVGAAIEREADVDVEAVAADVVLRQLEDAGASTSIVILDACRNLPVQRSFRDGSRGLARMDAPSGSFVAYSTAPGQVAADGQGANSPFATALMAEMIKPGQPIEATFRNVRRTVSQLTGGKQTPWDSSSLFDTFMFIPQ